MKYIIKYLKTILATLTIFSTFATAMANNEQHKELKMSTGEIIEIVIYSTKGGVNPTEHLMKSNAIGQVLAKMDGFVKRDFTQDLEGKWVDLVYWRDLDSAQHAASIFPTLPEALSFIDDINDSDMQMLHTSILSTIKK